MDNLTPITREEMLMNDEPLTPITREEKILAGGDVMVEGLSVTENGTYTAPEGKAYSPVNVAVPLPENAYLLKTASGTLVSFDDGTDLPMPSFICNIDAVQDLHGYDSPWVGGAGKNKINLADITTLSAGFVYNREPINVVVNTYTLSFNFTGGSGSISISLRNGETVVSTLQDQPLVNGLNTFTLPTLSNNADSISLYAGIVGTYENFMLEVGSTATSFAPYSNICPISGHTGVDAVISPTTEASAGTTYSVSWQTEAGEVFGGYVDLVSGVLTVTHGYADLGDLTWTYSSSSGRSLFTSNNITDYKHTGSNDIAVNAICECFTNVAMSTTFANGQMGMDGHETNHRTIICDNRYTDATAFKTAMNGVQLVYELATPQTYQLTPTQIKSLRGNNNAWCSTGDVDIDYFAKEVEG